MISLLVLHGWGLSAEKFEPLAQGLECLGYRVYVPDFPGFGKSPVPKRPLHLADYARFVHEYIRAKKIHRPVIIGHSFGGRVALKYVSMHQRVVRAIILTGTPGFTPVPRRKLLFFISIAKAGKLFMSLPILRIFQDAVRRWYYYVVGAREFYRAEGVMRETFKNIVAEELVTPMKSVGVPCLLVWGADDRITPTWIARKMHATISGSRLIEIPGFGHGVPYNNPDVFISNVRQFLSRL